MSVVSIVTDCDGDSLLIQVTPKRPACHLGLSSCFQPAVRSKITFLAHLSELIATRAAAVTSSSYTAQLLQSGVNRCAQKVGEEKPRKLLLPLLPAIERN